MKTHPTIAALAAVLRARAVHAEIESGQLCEDGVVAALVTRSKKGVEKLCLTSVLDGVTDRELRHMRRREVLLDRVSIAEEATRIELRIAERARQAARNDERTIEQAAE